MQGKIWYLKQCKLFERLTAAETEQLERNAVVRMFPRGSLVYTPNEPGQSILVLAVGRIKIKDITADGKESILAFIEEGEIFGELALIDDQPRHDYAEAVLDSRVVSLPRDDMLRVIERRPDIALAVTKLIGLRRRRIENRLTNLLFRTSRERIVRLLCELLDTHGVRQGAVWQIKIPLSHQDLASLIGVTRETVTAVLGQLQHDGVIHVSRRRIEVLDRARLKGEADIPTSE